LRSPLVGLVVAGVMMSGVGWDEASGQELLTAGDVVGLSSPAPDLKLHYGDLPLQFGHLRLPAGDGPFPVVVFIHGGCWLAEYGIGHVGPLEVALADLGFAVWSLEYRRVGDDGGGWPGTFLDVGLGADHLRALAEDHPLDLDRVLAAGHSAGGHLALWLAARDKIPPGADLFADRPLRVHGVVGLAPAADLEGLHEQGTCGNVVDRLMGGSPAEVPARYATGSPMRLAPIPVPQTLVIGAHDRTWSPAGEAYHRRAEERGARDVDLIVAPNSGHFEMIVPDTETWSRVAEAFRARLNAIERGDPDLP
jgi:acetyl esterase/lipase